MSLFSCILLAYLLWAVFFPVTFGREMRRVCNGIREGWMT